MVLQWIRQFYLPENILAFLREPIFPAISFSDPWILIHFVVGILLALILTKKRVKLAIALILLYEVFELYLLANGLIIKEPVLNILADIIVGIGGFIVGGKLRK